MHILYINIIKAIINVSIYMNKGEKGKCHFETKSPSKYTAYVLFEGYDSNCRYQS